MNAPQRPFSAPPDTSLKSSQQTASSASAQPSFCIENTHISCYGVQVEKRRTIVVIDDDQTQAKLLNDYLTENGFKVHLSFNGTDGEQMVYDVHPDAIILDLYLPDMMGTAVASQLRSNRATRNTPIILCTAYNIGTAQKVEGFRSGIDDLLIRPFDLSELLARLEAIFRRADTRPKTELLAGIDAIVGKTAAPPPAVEPLPPVMSAPAMPVQLPFEETPAPTLQPINFVQRIWQILNHPKKAFQTLEENSDFLISLFLVAATPLILSLYKLSEKTGGFDGWIGVLSLGLVLHFVMWIGMGGLLHLTLPFEGTTLSMKKALSLAGLCWAPRFLSATFSFVYGIVMLSGWFGKVSEFSSSVDLIPGLPMSPWVSVVSHIGIFDVWCAVLILIGVWTVCDMGKRRWTSITVTIAIVELLCSVFLNT